MNGRTQFGEILSIDGCIGVASDAPTKKSWFGAAVVRTDRIHKEAKIAVKVMTLGAFDAFRIYPMTIRPGALAI